MLGELTYRNLDDDPSLDGHQHHDRGARPGGRRPSLRPDPRRRASARAPAGSRPWLSRCTSPTSRGRATSGRHEHRRVVHVVVPEGVDDPTTPSGGNVYDRRLCEELTRSGWSVQEHAVSDTLAGVLGPLPDDAVALVDGLVAVTAPEALLREAEPAAARRTPAHAVRRARRRRPGPGAAGARGGRAVVTTSEWSRRWVLEHYGLAAAATCTLPSPESTRPSSRRAASPGVDCSASPP